MAGRIRRKAVVAAMTAAADRAEALPTRCALCERVLGRKVEWHHPVPKSRGGRVTVPVHPICHRTIHATIGNAELERMGADWAALRAIPELARFLDWVAGKEPDFNAPTRRAAGQPDIRRARREARRALD